MPHLYYNIRNATLFSALAILPFTTVSHLVLLYYPFLVKRRYKNSLTYRSLKIIGYIGYTFDFLITTLFWVALVSFSLFEVSFDQWTPFWGVVWNLICIFAWYIDAIRIREPYRSEKIISLQYGKTSQSRSYRENELENMQVGNGNVGIENMEQNNVGYQENGLYGERDDHHVIENSIHNLRNRLYSPNDSLPSSSQTAAKEKLENGSYSAQYPADLESVPLKQNFHVVKKSSIPYTLWYFKTVQKGLKVRGVRLFPLFIILFVISSIISFSLVRLCVCTHPKEISSRITRLGGPSCSSDEICFTYLTLPENPTEEMIVKFHAGSIPSSSVLYFDTVPRNGIIENYSHKINCAWINMEFYILDETRIVHTCDLTNLTPNTTYYFVNTYVNAKSDEIIQSKYEKKFKTIHNSNTEPVRFAVAGDRYSYSEISKSLLKEAVNRDISFFTIGGDLVYENGIIHCYRRWDSFFREYEELAQYNGYSIPLLTSIGNHEALFWQFDVSPNEAVGYLMFLSHTIGDVGITRKLNHIHKIGGHTSLTILDSGIVQSHKSQVPWLHEVWNGPKYKNTHKLVLYHAPIYPSSRDLDYKWGHTGRKYWEPLFDHYNISVAFENHDHLFKRSKMLKSGGEIVNKGGTVYLGDGSMGVGRMASKGNLPRYLEKRAAKFHFWLVETTGEWSDYEAIDENGKIFDRLRLELQEGEWTLSSNDPVLIK